MDIVPFKVRSLRVVTFIFFIFSSLYGVFPSQYYKDPPTYLKGWQGGAGGGGGGTTLY
jgi:hypothetical protein